MKKNTFIELLSVYKKADNDLRELYQIGFDLSEGKYQLTNHFYEMLRLSILDSYTEEGWEWVSWYIFDSDWGNKGVEAWDKDGKPVAYDLDSLYDLLEGDDGYYKSKP
jgi:hypothetical protein